MDNMFQIMLLSISTLAFCNDLLYLIYNNFLAIIYYPNILHIVNSNRNNQYLHPISLIQLNS
jgi:hypothetical protein